MRKLTRIVTIILSVIVLSYIVIAADTVPVLVRAKGLFKGDKNAIQETNDRLLRYYYKDLETVPHTVDLTLFPLWVMHNFRHGFMFVYYSDEVINSSTGELLRGNSSIISRWEIEKINGKWFVADILEDP